MIRFTVVLFDNLSIQAKHLKTRLLDLAEFKARGNFDIVVSTNLDEDLKNLSHNCKYAVVIALGSNWHTSREIIDSVQYAQDTQAPLIAHILEREEYYEFHPQWFVLDLQVYKELLFPSLATGNSVTETEVITVIRSAENFHHTYTPHWIKPGTGYERRSIPDRLFGYRLINQLLRKGYTIYNVPQYIRDRKSFCYPDNNVDEIYKSMADINYVSPSVDKHFDWLVRGQRENVYAGTGYYPANTEPIFCYNHNELPNIKFNYFAGVAGGVKPALLTNTKLFDEKVHIVIFDYSDAALDWQKHLYNTWNGDITNLENVFDNFCREHPGYNPIISLNKTFTEKFTEILIEQGSSINELSAAWKKYKQQSVEFRKLDLLDISTVDIFANDLQDVNTSAYLWFSNVFYMDWQMFYYGKEEMSKKQQMYYNELKSKSQSSIVIEHCNILQVLRPTH